VIKRIAHIGVAVKDMERSEKLFSKLFGIPSSGTEAVPEQKSTITFYPIGNSSVELIESLDSSSAIAKFIDKRGEGVHHICFEVENIEEEIRRLKNSGFQFVKDVPEDGGDGYRIVFLHPKSTNGVLVELCEKLST
jgi:methylmalonyl-CoA/ethylmalonyl-CoA epimerase